MGAYLIAPGEHRDRLKTRMQPGHVLDNRSVNYCFGFHQILSLTTRLQAGDGLHAALDHMRSNTQSYAVICGPTHNQTMPYAQASTTRLAGRLATRLAFIHIGALDGVCSGQPSGGTRKTFGLTKLKSMGGLGKARGRHSTPSRRRWRHVVSERAGTS